MRLLISKENFLEKEMDVCHISTVNFMNNCFIPFIVNNKWDECIIELSDDLGTGYIPQVFKGVRIIAKLDLEDISPKQLTLLIEVYPEISGKLRLAYRRDRSSIAGLLEGKLYGK